VRKSQTKIILSWDDYQESYLKIHRDKICVAVSIPRAIRHLFGNAPVRIKVAGTTEADFKRKRRSLTHEIYQEFDKRQADHAYRADHLRAIVENEGKNFGTSDWELDQVLQRMISLFAKAVIPQKSDYNYFELFDEQKYPDFKGIKFVRPLTDSLPHADLYKLRSNMDTMANWIRGNQMRATDDEIEAARDYLQPNVRSYFEDLIVTAAKSQNITPPTFSQPTKEEFWLSPDIEAFHPRPRKNSQPTMSSVKVEYFEWIEKYYDKNDTKNKLRLAYEEFQKYMGDLPLTKIDGPMVVSFAQAQLEYHPRRSKVVIKNRNWAMNIFCRDFCIPQRHMLSSPFFGAKLTKYGAKGSKWLEYTDQDLDKIFSYDWAEQELLLLRLALATGMRLDEIALLTWERIKQTNRFYFVSLHDEGDEKVSVKNEGSARFVPLHPALQLPSRGVGRLFNYKIDGDGKASMSAGRAVNPILKELIGEKRKSFHSFRSTFIIKLTQVGTPENINKQITGHGTGDTNTDVYGGISVDDRFEWVRKIQLFWLNPEAH
jgi:integrase